MLTAGRQDIAFTMWELMEFSYCRRLAASYSFEHVFEGDEVRIITSEQDRHDYARGLAQRVDAALDAASLPARLDAGTLTVTGLEEASALLGVRPSSWLEGA
jgi:hypothetical protein